ncbi:MAG: NHL repeat-containing protein [Acidobacteriota bacterium]
MIRRFSTVCAFLLIAPLLAPSLSGAQETAVPLERFTLGAHGPSRVSVDSQGRFYVTDPERKQVLVMDARGQMTVSVDVNAYPVGIAVGSDGRIYLGDGDRHAVHVFDAAGSHLFDLGEGANEFKWPTDIALDETLGRIYVADSEAHEVKAYDMTGVAWFSLSSTGSGPLSFPTAVAVDPLTGNVVVSDHNNGQLQLFDNQGVWIRSISRLTSPAGVSIDAVGRIYVAEAFQGRVQVFDQDGTHVGSVGEFGTGAGKLRTPTDTVFDPYGRLAVVSYNNGVLEIYGPEGYSNPPDTVPPPQLQQLTFPSDTVHATVVFRPPVLNLSSQGQWLKAFIEIADGSAAEIDLPTVFLNDQIAADGSGEQLADQDEDGVPELVVLFDRQAVISLINVVTGSVTPASFELVVKGRTSNLSFEARDSLRIAQSQRSTQ